MTIRSTYVLLIVFLMAFTADALADEGAESNPEVNPCVSDSSDLGDSANWAVRAITQYADGQHQAAVTTVDACFDIWAPEAGQSQKAMFDAGEKCPRTGRVSKKTKAKIQENYLMNDVSMALWAKARSLHERGDMELAKEAYGKCVYMACGRAWDPKAGSGARLKTARSSLESC